MNIMHNFLHHRLLGVIAFSLLSCSSICAYTYNGTSTLLTVSTHDSLSAGNDAAGLVWFQNGFKLPASAGTFTVDIVLPVSGSIDLNGGQLILSHDLVLASDATLTDSSGSSAASSIDGGGKSIFLSNDLSYSGTTQTLTIANNLVIDGCGHTFTIGSTNSVAIAAGKTLTLKNMTLALTTTASSPFTAGNSSSTLILENVAVGLAHDCTWATGGITIKGKTIFLGIQGTSFINTSTANFTIASNSWLTLLDGMVYYHNNSGTTNFVMADRSSRLELMGATFKGYNTGTADLVLTVGTLVVDHKSFIQPNVAGITIGDGASSANDLTIEIRPAASIGVTTGTLTYANYAG